jgi:hypothetical protein
VITLELVIIGDADDKIDAVVNIETVGVSVGTDALAECVELVVTVPVIDCIDDFNEEVDAVRDCKADDERESIFDTEASVENEGTAEYVEKTLPVRKFVVSDVCE